MRTRRVTNWCLDILSNGQERTTFEILDYINNVKRSRHGTTAHGLGNILGKDPRFEKTGETYAWKGIGKYKVSCWTISGAGTMFLGQKNLEADKMEKEKKKIKEQAKAAKVRATWTHEMKEDFIRNRLINKMSLKQISDKMGMRLTQVKGMQKYYNAGALDNIVKEMFDE